MTLYTVTLCGTGPIASSLHFGPFVRPHRLNRTRAAYSYVVTCHAFLARSVCLSVCTEHTRESRKNGWTNRDAVSEADS